MILDTNEKFEGFFAVCKAKGLNSEQGVMIPASNVRNLMLKQEIVDAVWADQFHARSVASIQEGIEVLTGVPAGKNDNGSFVPNGIYARVNERLAKMADEMAKFGTKEQSIQV